MKKKILAFLCVIACTLSFAACGGSTEYTEIEQSKLTSCEETSYYLIQIAEAYGTEETVSAMTEAYAKHEMEYILENISYNLTGYAIESEYGTFEGMLTTYYQAVDDMNGLISVGDCTSEISGDEIIVTYELYGNDADGTFTFTYTNDLFTKLTEAEAKADLSFAQNMHKAGQNMGNAGLNTLLGMGTVFAILILISLIIASFNLFKKKPKTVEAPKSAENDAPVATEELTDDTELVAVIMAAISAYEEANGGSTDGFVVRSIRRSIRRN